MFVRIIFFFFLQIACCYTLSARVVRFTSFKNDKLFSSSLINEYDTLSKKNDTLLNVPPKYFQGMDNKIEKYNARVTLKTERTLEKLAKWENKVHTLLLKANPEAAQRLFNNNQVTFTSILQQYRDGKSTLLSNRASYDEYRDRVNTQINYLNKQGTQLNDSTIVISAKNTKTKLQKLDSSLNNTDAIESFIKERKKLLITQSIQYIGNSKYLQNINKEAYYYSATLKNYKEIFSNPEKTEEAVFNVLGKIPAFNDFVSRNSFLASLFHTPVSDPNDPAAMMSLAGLQTRNDVSDMIGQQVSAGGPNAQSSLQQNLQDAQGQLSQLKNKLSELGSSGGNSANMPDFKPNNQKSKTFFQRLEYGTNIQSQQSNYYFPSTSNIGLSVGYKLNNKSVVGLGASYAIGLGKDWNNINFSSQGAGARSFVDIKLKGGLWMSGGYEMNYKTTFTEIAQLRNLNAWQQSGLLGLSKQIPLKNKFLKKTNVQVLWDFLSYQQVPKTQAILFRVGYGF